MGTWWKTSQPDEGDWEGKPGDQWEHPSPVGKLMSLKRSCRWWKTSQPDDGKTEEENRTRDQSMKNLPADEGAGEENRKIIDIVDEKTFQPRLRTEKEKPRLMERGGVCSRKDLFEGGTWMIRDLVRIRCYVVLQESNCHGQLPCRLPDAPCARETDLRLPAGFWL